MENQNLINITGFTERINNLQQWPPTPELLRVLSGMSLEYINLLPYNVGVDRNLISVVIDSYDHVQRAFVFGNDIKLVYSLQDIFYLTGLPINGKAVAGVTKQPAIAFEEAFGMKPTKEMMPRKEMTQISLTWLKNNYSSRPLIPDTEDYLPHIRAYMLYLLGCYILPGSTGDVVTTDYLSILMDINDIKNYAWGAAALAHLHASLESCKKEKKGGTKMYGLVFPLMLFFIEHVPQLRNAILYSAPPPKVDPLPMNFPLMCEWSKILNKRIITRTTYNKKSKYLDILGRLTIDAVDWQPYGRLDAAFIPHAYGGQMQYAMSRTVLMCFDTCVYHRPHLSPMQFGILVGSENALHDEINLHVIKHHGPKGKDFTKYNINIGRKRANYDEMFKEWERRDLCVLNRDAMEHGGGAPSEDTKLRFVQGPPPSPRPTVIEISSGEEDDSEDEDEDEPAIVSKHLSPGHATTDLDMAELVTSDAELPDMVEPPMSCEEIVCRLKSRAPAFKRQKTGESSRAPPTPLAGPQTRSMRSHHSRLETRLALQESQLRVLEAKQKELATKYMQLQARRINEAKEHEEALSLAVSRYRSSEAFKKDVEDYTTAHMEELVTSWIATNAGRERIAAEGVLMYDVGQYTMQRNMQPTRMPMRIPFPCDFHSSQRGRR